MATTLNYSSGTKRPKRPACRGPVEPVVVRIPVLPEHPSLSIQEAEAIVRQAGGKPMTKDEMKYYRRFLKNSN
jgi:hypothetical protein